MRTRSSLGEASHRQVQSSTDTTARSHASIRAFVLTPRGRRVSGVDTANEPKPSNHHSDHDERAFLCFDIDSPDSHAGCTVEATRSIESWFDYRLLGINAPFGVEWSLETRASVSHNRRRYRRYTIPRRCIRRLLATRNKATENE